jgi:tight adherence protein B
VKDYSSYQFTWKEKLRYISEGLLITGILGYLFYKSWMGILALSPLIYLYMIRKKEKLSENRRWKLNLEFRDGIMAWSASLEAGYSSEHALEEAYKDLSRIYSDKAMIMQEFTYMINQVNMNIPIEKALEDFGSRSCIEDIQSFSDVFYTAKRTGGDLISIIKTAVGIISDKIEVKREINTLIAAKRLEASIMKTIPVLILIYLFLSSPGFLDPLYHNFFGIIVMSVFLFLYLGAYLIIDKIIAIEV